MKTLRAPISPTEPTRFGRILLHLRCLYHDRKYRWHLAGVWREIRPWQHKPSISPAAA
jgi:hypothetical protein